MKRCCQKVNESHRKATGIAKNVARCRSGQLYGGGENVKVVFPLSPPNLHLDFFAAAKPSRLGTARGEVTLLLSLDKRKF
jgi:hypothetical protein